jgi:hypothetical protein
VYLEQILNSAMMFVTYEGVELFTPLPVQAADGEESLTVIEGLDPAHSMGMRISQLKRLGYISVEEAAVLFSKNVQPDAGLYA